MRVWNQRRIPSARRLGTEHDDVEELFDLLLWYGVFGVELGEDRLAYIYDVSYDLERLRTLIRNRGNGNAMFQINPAFWSALDGGGA